MALAWGVLVLQPTGPRTASLHGQVLFPLHTPLASYGVLVEIGPGVV